jgi:hypothetical protein
MKPGHFADVRAVVPKRLGPSLILFFCGLLLLSPASAIPVLDFTVETSPLVVTVDSLGGGLFQYNFTLNNVWGEPLSGLNLFHGSSAFGLNTLSSIVAPPGWSFFSPLPPLVDELNWFSLSPATDVPVGGSLSGFSFRSTTDPATLGSDAYAFDVIGGITGTQLVPDRSSTAFLLALGVAGLVFHRWISGRPRSPPTDGLSPSLP